MTVNKIQATLNELKRRLSQSKNGTLEVKVDDDRVFIKSFSFNSPEDEKSLLSFFGSNNWTLPEDYKKFLLNP
ncbi:hypothetical protein [Paenibacillus sp. YYML68]|uniref:hypothetical protein n=1 Tax=Paenibacillus sp. YYML68 TaxID=2909250 RepID=UPI002490CF50|nr:hypothetical protein [Paenibacillus sp. YYML68]